MTIATETGATSAPAVDYAAMRFWCAGESDQAVAGQQHGGC
jgi:hypothetical protein